MGRNAQLVRQWTMIRKLALNYCGCTILELSQILNVTTRTIRRDLDCLEQSGFPLYVVETDDGMRWRIRKEKLVRSLLAFSRHDDEAEEG